MTRKSSSTISKKAVGSKKRASSPVSEIKLITARDNIHEAAERFWIAAQLIIIREFMREHDADDEMLEAIDYAIEDNKDWIDPAISAGILSRELEPGIA